MFILFSKDCVSKYWAEICKMKILNSAIYDKKKNLIIPVSAEKNTGISMGMKSAHKFHNHNRDKFYKEALTKLVRQYIT